MTDEKNNIVKDNQKELNEVEVREEAEGMKEDEKQQKIEELEEQAKRYLADYQNLQRRVQEEKYNWVRQANKELLLKFLPILDTLMLAQKHIADKGLALSIDQFLKALEQEGVKRIKTIGEKFDPQTMEAIGISEGKKDIVTEEVRAGFTLYDNVLRTVQVIVGK